MCLYYTLSSDSPRLSSFLFPAFQSLYSPMNVKALLPAHIYKHRLRCTFFAGLVSLLVFAKPRLFLKNFNLFRRHCSCEITRSPNLVIIKRNLYVNNLFLKLSILLILPNPLFRKKKLLKMQDTVASHTWADQLIYWKMKIEDLHFHYSYASSQARV